MTSQHSTRTSTYSEEESEEDISAIEEESEEDVSATENEGEGATSATEDEGEAATSATEDEGEGATSANEDEGEGATSANEEEDNENIAAEQKEGQESSENEEDISGGEEEKEDTSDGEKEEYTISKIDADEEDDVPQDSDKESGLSHGEDRCGSAQSNGSDAQRGSGVEQDDDDDVNAEDDKRENEGDADGDDAQNGSAAAASDVPRVTSSSNAQSRHAAPKSVNDARPILAGRSERGAPQDGYGPERRGATRVSTAAYDKKRALPRRKGDQRLFMTVNVQRERAGTVTSHAPRPRTSPPKKGAHTSPQSRGSKAPVRPLKYSRRDVDVPRKQHASAFPRHRRPYSDDDGDDDVHPQRAGASRHHDDARHHRRNNNDAPPGRRAWVTECIRCLRPQKHCRCPPVLRQFRRRVSYSARCTTCHATSLEQCTCRDTVGSDGEVQKGVLLCRRCNREVARCSCPPVLSWFRSLPEDGKGAMSVSRADRWATEARRGDIDGDVEKEDRLRALHFATTAPLDTYWARGVPARSTDTDINRVHTLESHRDAALREVERLQDLAPFRERTLQKSVESAQDEARLRDLNNDRIRELEVHRDAALRECERLQNFPSFRERTLPKSVESAQRVRDLDDDPIRELESHRNATLPEGERPQDLASFRGRTLQKLVEGTQHETHLLDLDDNQLRELELHRDATLQEVGRRQYMTPESDLASQEARSIGDGDRRGPPIVDADLHQRRKLERTTSSAFRVVAERERATLSPLPIGGGHFIDDEVAVADRIQQYLRTLPADTAIHSPAVRLRTVMSEMHTVFDDTESRRDFETVVAPARVHDPSSAISYPNATPSRAAYPPRYPPHPAPEGIAAHAPPDPRADRATQDIVSHRTQRGNINARLARELDLQSTFASNKLRTKEVRRLAMDAEHQLYAARQRALEARVDPKDHTLHHSAHNAGTFRDDSDTGGHEGKNELRILRNLRNPKDIGTSAMKSATHTAAKVGYMDGPRLAEQHATSLFGTGYSTSPRHDTRRGDDNTHDSDDDDTGHGDSGRKRRKLRWVDDVYHAHTCYVKEQYPELFAPRPDDEPWRRPQKYVSAAVRVGGGFRIRARQYKHGPSARSARHEGSPRHLT